MLWGGGPQIRAGDVVRWRKAEVSTRPTRNEHAAVAVRALCENGHEERNMSDGAQPLTHVCDDRSSDWRRLRSKKFHRPVAAGEVGGPGLPQR